MGIDNSTRQVSPIHAKKIEGEKGIPLFHMEGLAASPNKFTQTNHSLEKEWAVAEDTEDATSNAHLGGTCQRDR